MAGGLLGYNPDDDSFVITGAFGVLGLQTITIAPGVRGWGATLSPVIADGNPHWIAFGEQQVSTDPSKHFSLRFLVGSLTPPFRVDFFLVNPSGVPIDPSTVLVPAPPYPVPGFGHFHVHRGGLASFSAPG